MVFIKYRAMKILIIEAFDVWASAMSGYPK